MAKEEKLRSEIDDKYKWDLTKMYKDGQAFEKDFTKLETLIDQINNYKGILTSDSKTLYNYMKLEDEIDVIFTNLYVYANCKNDEDVTNKESQKTYNKVLGLLSKYNEVASFTGPELLKTDYDVIKKYIKENHDLKEYAFDLEQIYRYQPYVLSEKEEKLLSNISELSMKFKNNFNIINNSIIDFGYIKDAFGNDVKLTNGNYSKYIRSEKRSVRKDAYLKRSLATKKFANLISTDYEAYVKSCSMIAKAKGYPSNLYMYLFDDGVSEEVYDNLLKVANDNLGVLHKYYKLRKDILKLDILEPYDLSAPLVKESNKKYTPDDAIELICKAMHVYGDEYVNQIRKLYKDRCIDFYPNKGKKSGYYQNDSYKGIVVLGNYNDNYTSVSSIAHELGHAMHSYYSKKGNKEHLSEYAILVAEIASLTNEMLLSYYVINNTGDKNLKLQAINNILEVFSDNFFGTLAHGSVFEKIVHEKIYNGESLTEEDFNNIFDKIIKRHNGSLVNTSEYSKYNWSRVPHFYTPFYYYKYSIGACGACYVAKKILSKDKEFLSKYLNFLKLGGSMMPLDELKTIGLDLTNTKVIEEGINYFSELIDEFMVIYNS